MDINEGIQRLKEQIENIDSLKFNPAFNSRYQVWDQTTRRILEAIFDQETVNLYVGVQQTRPAMNPGDSFMLFIDVLNQKRSMLVEILKEHERMLDTEVSFIKRGNSSEQGEGEGIKIKTNKVFLVHGHDTVTKEMVARFLTSIDLQPIILHEQPNEGRTIIEKFEDYSDVPYAIVLLTPDDVCKSVDNDGVEFQRARQNVILEFGYFIGKLGRKNVCGLKRGNVELPSDYSGVLYIDFDETNSWKINLVKEMKAVGLDIDANKVI